MFKSKLMARLCGVVNSILFRMGDRVGCYWVDVIEPYVFTVDEYNVDTYHRYAIN